MEFDFSPVIALYRPLIPPNLGNIGRLCVGIGSPLYVVGKSPIKMDDRTVKRAGLDYWHHVRLKEFARFKDFYLETKGRRLIAFTKEASKTLWNFKFQKGDVLIFGNETHGLPPASLKLVHDTLRIPMWGDEIRSLNLSNSVSIAAYEYLRQVLPEPEKGGNIVERTYYRK